MLSIAGAYFCCNIFLRVSLLVISLTVIPLTCGICEGQYVGETRIYPSVNGNALGDSNPKSKRFKNVAFSATPISAKQSSVTHTTSAYTYELLNEPAMPAYSTISGLCMQQYCVRLYIVLCIATPLMSTCTV